MNEVTVLDELITSLGVAAPLVVLLYFQLRECSKERADLTKQFLEAMQTTISGNNTQMLKLAETNTDTVAAINDLRGSIATRLDRVERTLERNTSPLPHPETGIP